MAKQDQQTWTQQIAKHDELAMQGAELLWMRMQILVGVHDDPEFRKHMSDHGEDVYEFLDYKVADTGHSYALLVRVLEMFPAQKQWAGQLLQRMVAQVLEADRKKDQESRPRGERTSWKQRYEELKERYDQLVKENEQLHAKVDELRRICEQRVAAA